MPDFEAVEVLTQAKERIFENGWGRGSAENRTAFGDDASLCLEDALCGRGNFLSMFTGTPQSRAGDYVKSALGGLRSLWLWNDLTASPGDVFDALDEAILLAKEAPTPGTPK